MDIKIRPATGEDIALIQEMAEVTFRHTYAEIISAGQMEFMMEWMYSDDSLAAQLSTQKFFLAYDGQTPCGYTSIERQGRDAEGVDIYHLQKLYVMPQYQHQGVGSALIGAVMDFAREICTLPARIELNVNRGNSAVEFYKKKGLRVLRTGDFPIGNGFYMNDYIMGVEL